MCLDERTLKTFKDNDNVRIGYKVFDKSHNIYYNPFKGCYIKHTMGSWYKNKKRVKLTVGYPLHHITYESGFHFYSSIPRVYYQYEVVVECICENITATGQQNDEDAFVAQSYRLMREV